MKEKHLIYGIVFNNMFISDNMFVKVGGPNGLYTVDVLSNNYLKSLAPADTIEFDNFIKKSKKLKYVYGLSFHSGFIPFDMMKYKSQRTPIMVHDTMADEWEIVKAIHIPHKNLFYFAETVTNNISMTLMEVKEAFEAEKGLKDLKGIIPEMRVLYTFHNFEKALQIENEKKLKEEELKLTVEGRLKFLIENAGGIFINYKELRNRGYEVNWQLQREQINTLIDTKFRVVEAGFCVSGFDNTQSMQSVVNLLKDYKEDGSYIHKTRSLN